MKSHRRMHVVPLKKTPVTLFKLLARQKIKQDCFLTKAFKTVAMLKHVLQKHSDSEMKASRVDDAEDIMNSAKKIDFTSQFICHQARKVVEQRVANPLIKVIAQEAVEAAYLCGFCFELIFDKLIKSLKTVGMLKHVLQSDSSSEKKFRYDSRRKSRSGKVTEGY